MQLSNLSTFRAFGSRNYQLFFGGQLISRIGMWMQRTAVVWLVYTMTHSTFMLGVTVFAEQFPSFLFSVLGGTVADRYDRYKVLMVTQIVSALQAVALAVLFFTNHHQVWMILSLSVLLGIANAFDVPARQPMVHDIINDPKDLPNAIALNSSMNNLARLIGPALSGWVLEAFGAGNCFLANAISFVAVIFSLTMMKLPKYKRKEKDETMAAGIKEGFSYLKRTPEIGITLLIVMLICLMVASYNTLLPFYAREIFNGNARTFGYINASIGFGALLSTVVLASFKSNKNLKRVLLINIIVLGVGLMLFSHISFFPVSLVLSMVCGFGIMSVIPICNTIVQVESAKNMRGRMISYFAMTTFGMLPLGSLFIGWVSKYAGAPNTILVQGIAALVIAALFSGFLRKAGKSADKQVETAESEDVNLQSLNKI